MQNKCKNACLIVYFKLPSMWLFLCRTLYGVSHWLERHANSQTASYSVDVVAHVVEDEVAEVGEEVVVRK